MRRRPVLLAQLLALLLSGALLSTASGAQEIEIIQLRHRTAEEVVPNLRAFLEPGGALTGQGYQLFLRASAGNVRQLKQLLVTLDRTPRQLEITVRQDRADERAARVAGADGSVTLSTRRVTGSVNLEAGNARTFGTAGASQTIRVLEGGRAYIAIGTSIPLTFRRWVVDQSGISEAQGIVSYDAVSGFHARPQLVGGLVTIELAPEQASFTGHAVERAQLSTTVRGRLGEWIAVGGADTREESSLSGLATAGNNAQATQRGVWLKVEEADSPR